MFLLSNFERASRGPARLFSTLFIRCNAIISKLSIQYQEGMAYDTNNALGCWNISAKPVENRVKILYRIYMIPLFLAWFDLFLDIGYVSDVNTRALQYLQ